MSTDENNAEERSSARLSRVQAKHVTNGMRSFLTRSKWFERLTHYTFTICDSDKTGMINKDELYAGILLVHVNLAKYAGAAACYPSSRKVVEEMFQAVDSDTSGLINEEEFAHILRICSRNIASRIAVYYAILILMVPHLADGTVRAILHFDEWMGWNATKTQITIFTYLEKLLSWNQVAETVIGLAFFFLIIPMIFELIDASSTQKANLVRNDSCPAPQQVQEEETKKKNE
mmetsp:Transcript_10711/g.14177  ORF Transcript_10711/g.14177 Transcript_10711/m.14177 type:complete len:232 (+) Transcript_10711:324-1019(+)